MMSKYFKFSVMRQRFSKSRDTEYYYDDESEYEEDYHPKMKNHRVTRKVIFVLLQVPPCLRLNFLYSWMRS